MVTKRLRQAVGLALKQGSTPEKIALSLAIGLLMGIIPLLWGSSAICILIGWRWHLNHTLLQAANYAAYPLQIVLFVPFFETASRLFGSETLLDPRLLHRLAQSPLEQLEKLWLLNLEAMAIWLLGSLLLLPVLYATFLSVLRLRMGKQC